MSEKEIVAAGETPEEWQRDCERVVFAACEWLRLADMGGGVSAIIEVIRTAPEPADEERFSKSKSLFARAAVDAFGRRGSSFPVDRAATAFHELLISAPPERRKLLVASVVGALLGLGTGYNWG